MSTLVSISPLPAAKKSVQLSSQKITSLPVVVLSPHNQCNCRCVMCDIWRIREAKQITTTDLTPHVNAFRDFGVRWVVFTGGEPQLNADLFLLADMLRAYGMRVTMLTAGLLLESAAQEIAESIDDVIVSLDGPGPVHNGIRRIPSAFERLAAGVAALRKARPDMQIRARCTVQKANCTSLRETIDTAKGIHLNSISFLAADVTSTAFNHLTGWLPERQGKVGLSAGDVDELEEEIETMIRLRRADIEAGFVAESATKLRRVVQHFRAQLGQAPAVAPRCNAPWVSTVIEASGDVRPCFFHPAIGNIHRQTLAEILNGAPALQFRHTLDIATNPICRRCVCSLYLPRTNA